MWLMPQCRWEIAFNELFTLQSKHSVPHAISIEHRKCLAWRTFSCKIHIASLESFNTPVVSRPQAESWRKESYHFLFSASMPCPQLLVTGVKRRVGARSFFCRHPRLTLSSFMQFSRLRFQLLARSLRFYYIMYAPAVSPSNKLARERQVLLPRV